MPERLARLPHIHRDHCYRVGLGRCHCASLDAEASQDKPLSSLIVLSAHCLCYNRRRVGDVVQVLKPLKPDNLRHEVLAPDCPGARSVCARASGGVQHSPGDCASVCARVSGGHSAVSAVSARPCPVWGTPSIHQCKRISWGSQSALDGTI